MNNLPTQIIDLAIQIQQIPAPTFAEGERGEFVRELFIKEKLKNVSVDSLGNVFARLPGKQKKAKALIVSAHLDTVFPATVNLQIKKEAKKIIAPGIGDNSLGVAALFGIICSLRERKITLQNDVWFVANVGEEGLGDLRGMRAVVERFGTHVLGYLVLEGLALGHVYHRAIGVKRYRITAKTAGGHSWSDYGQPSAVHELASLITKLTAIRLPREPRTTLNIGTMNGGRSINTIADEASLELDLRSESDRTLEELEAHIQETISRHQDETVAITLDLVGSRPGGDLGTDHPLVLAASESLRRNGERDRILEAGSTDASVPLNRGLPGICVGLTSCGLLSKDEALKLSKEIEIFPVGKKTKIVDDSPN